jgi:hypothetical protein
MHEALGKAGQLVKVAERLGGLRDEMAESGADGAGALCRHQQPSREAGTLRVDRRLAFGLARLGPAFGPDQRHEGDGAVVLFLELVIVDTADEQQRLVSTAADRGSRGGRQW